MKTCRTFTVIVFLFIFLFTAALPALQLSDELEITEIETDVFLVTHSFPWPANSLLVIMDESNILWMDTPYTPEATAEVLEWLYSRYGTDCMITEINTGFHIDNLGGNETLLSRGIPVYGSTLTCELLQTHNSTTMSKMTGWLQGRRYEKYRRVYDDFNFQPPAITFDINEEQHLQIGSESVNICYPGPTHTFDNIIVYLPDRNILFGGCMILSADTKKPGYTDDGDLSEWVLSLKKLLIKFPETRLVIPGHGAPGGIQLISHTISVLEANNGN